MTKAIRSYPEDRRAGIVRRRLNDPRCDGLGMLAAQDAKARYGKEKAEDDQDNTGDD